MPDISIAELLELRKQLHPLLGVKLPVLSIPAEVLAAFEPSQVGTIVGTLMDACIPHLDVLLPGHALLDQVGLTKAPGIIKDREGYPDYLHKSGKRLELKLLYVDPGDGLMKTTDTPREPSARITQKVTVKNVQPDKDALLVVAYQLRAGSNSSNLYSPEILDVGVFSMIECVRARDHRLTSAGGRWFGDYETPTILSRSGKLKQSRGLVLDTANYGRKEDEGRDFNEDTNFGKLKRIPYKPLQEFLRDKGANYANSGSYPSDWRI
jgi:hypothetical protein